MKLFRKLAAAALAGVMALSLLTGCALGDAAKENAMLKALQTVGDLYQVKVSESDSLSKKASGIFKAFKNAKGKAWDIDELRKTEGSSDISTSVTYKETDYRVMFSRCPKMQRIPQNGVIRLMRFFIVIVLIDASKRMKMATTR